MQSRTGIGWCDRASLPKLAPRLMLSQLLLEWFLGCVGLGPLVALSLLEAKGVAHCSGTTRIKPHTLNSNPNP